MEPLIVTTAEAGQKIWNFLERRVENAGSDLHKWLRTGQVRRNGGRVKAFDRVETGDAIRVPPFAVLRERHEKEHASRRLGMNVIFENDDIIVLNKPAGLPTQNGTGHTDSVAQRLKDAFAGTDFVPAPAHRLDKETSGVLVAGKTYAALRGLTDALAGRSPQAPRKEYLAWVWGDWPWKEERELRDNLFKDEKTQRMVAVDSAINGHNDKPQEGKNAISVVRLLETRIVDSKTTSLLFIRLLTGRTHQIRVQLSSRKFPVVGDVLYGKGNIMLKLHSFRITLPPLHGITLPCLEQRPEWCSPWNTTDNSF